MKKETYEFLRDEFSQVFLNIEDPRLADDVSNAIKELLPVPDPETGLVKCGCGSPLKLIRGEFFEDKPEAAADCWVKCTNSKCDWEIWDCVTEKEIVFRANRAMGYKEDA